MPPFDNLIMVAKLNEVNYGLIIIMSTEKKIPNKTFASQSQQKVKCMLYLEQFNLFYKYKVIYNLQINKCNPLYYQKNQKRFISISIDAEKLIEFNKISKKYLINFSIK